MIGLIGCFPADSCADAKDPLARFQEKDERFSVSDSRTPQWDRTFAEAVADYYLSDSQFSGMTIVSQWKDDSADKERTGWGLQWAACRPRTLSFRHPVIRGILLIIWAAIVLPIGAFLGR